VTAAVGALAVLGFVVFLTLRASPIQHQDHRSS
jgi:hypothetical protein